MCRNGCCHIQPRGKRTYCIFGEGGSEGPGSSLGIAYTTDISEGRFTQVNWTSGVPGGTGLWMQPLGAAQHEIKLEAGAHMVQLDSGVCIADDDTALSLLSVPRICCISTQQPHLAG